MRSIACLVVLVVGSIGISASAQFWIFKRRSSAARENRPQNPNFSDVHFEDGLTISKRGVGFDDTHTAYLAKKMSSGEEIKFPISPKQFEVDHKFFKGWPYVLDKKGNVWTIDSSWRRVLTNKIWRVAWRRKGWATLESVGLGMIVGGVGLVDQATFQYFVAHDIGILDLSLGSATLVYCADAAYHTLCTKPRDVGFIGNLFTVRIAKNIKSMRYIEHPRVRDVELIQSTSGSETRSLILSTLRPEGVGTTKCMNALDGLI